jgi:hypothetical protein
LQISKNYVSTLQYRECTLSSKLSVLMEPIRTYLIPWIIVLPTYQKYNKLYIVEKKSLMLKYDLPRSKGL